MAKKDEEKAVGSEEKLKPVVAEPEADEEDEDDEEGDDEGESEDDETEDEGDEYEDEDEEDDEELAAAEAKGLHDHSLPPNGPEDPTWWLPHAFLGLLVTIGVLGFFGVFNKVLRPLLHKDDAPAAAVVSAAPVSSAPRPMPAQAPPTMKAGPDTPTYGAKHLVVMYKGSTRAPASVTRTKDEAKARAEEALKKIKGGAKFEDVVGDYSDEPNAKERGGDLGKFKPGSFDPKFVEAVQGLKVGETSGLVETQFGYHIILRTQ